MTMRTLASCDGTVDLSTRLPVKVVRLNVLGKHILPSISVRQQLLLVVQELLVVLDRELKVRALDNGVDRARLLAVTAVDALRHVDIVFRRPAAVVGAGLGLDGDGLGWADGLAELASDASLLSSRVASQRMLPTEAGRDRALLEGVVDGELCTNTHKIGRVGSATTRDERSYFLL